MRTQADRQRQTDAHTADGAEVGVADHEEGAGDERAAEAVRADKCSTRT